MAEPVKMVYLVTMVVMACRAVSALSALAARLVYLDRTAQKVSLAALGR